MKMCFTCLYNPINFINDQVREFMNSDENRSKKLDGVEIDRFQAKLYKEVVRIIEQESSGTFCESGQNVLEIIKNEQMIVSRKF